MVVKPIIAFSARRHGVEDEDILHAYFDPIRLYQLDDDLQMWIGPDRSARMLEIGVVEQELTVTVVHAMKARQEYVR